MIEVTQAMFLSFLVATGYVTDAEKIGFSLEPVTTNHFVKSPHNCRTETYEDNVIHVSFNDAIEFCKWSGYRIPTIEEYLELVREENIKDVWDFVIDENENAAIIGGSYMCNVMCRGYELPNKQPIGITETSRHVGIIVVK